MSKWILAVVIVIFVIVALRRRRETPPGLEQGGTRPAATRPDIDQLIINGRKIEAIKVYRQLYGGDLQNAKDAIEAREKTLSGK
ncbi:MAG: hypothetical protein HY700_05750 [Gemmatimonadetes bacterium]|nr:hypothetical protein [Gemmatimonadota bacterium]